MTKAYSVWSDEERWLVFFTLLQLYHIWLIRNHVSYIWLYAIEWQQVECVERQTHKQSTVTFKVFVLWLHNQHYYTRDVIGICRTTKISGPKHAVNINLMIISMKITQTIYIPLENGHGPSICSGRYIGQWGFNKTKLLSYTQRHIHYH